MTGWIVLVVVLAALALGYVLASTRAVKRERRAMDHGIAGEHQDTQLDPHPPSSQRRPPED